MHGVLDPAFVEVKRAEVDAELGVATRAAALELARFGVTCNADCPEAVLRVVVETLSGPECVLATADATLVAAHGAGGFSVMAEDRATRHVPATGSNPRRYLPNGIALAPDGSNLFAKLGAELDGVLRIDTLGEVMPLAETVDGVPIAPTNFVLVDAAGALWFPVSTRTPPRDKAWSHAVADGFIGLQDAGGARVLADGIDHTNEIAFVFNGRSVHVNETYTQRVSRFPLLTGPALGPKEVVRQLDGADFPDGICFDAEGGVWITRVGDNRVLLLRPDPGLQSVFEDTDPQPCCQAGSKQDRLHPRCRGHGDGGPVAVPQRLEPGFRRALAAQRLSRPAVRHRGVRL
jgi:sugar lactone lactonase YvrE